MTRPLELLYLAIALVVLVGMALSDVRISWGELP